MMLALPRCAASVPLARHAVTAALDRAGVTSECADDVELALSEACTNAYRHAQSGKSFEVLMTITGDQLTLDVLDAGNGLAPGFAPATAMPHPSTDGGRGISLMAALTDELVLDSANGDGGCVRLRKLLRWRCGAPFASPRLAADR
jgi:serine/threonine-protein kinase RsbW